LLRAGDEGQVAVEVPAHVSAAQQAVKVTAAAGQVPGTFAAGPGSDGGSPALPPKAGANTAEIEATETT
jgi:hypothetical protein